MTGGDDGQREVNEGGRVGNGNTPNITHPKTDKGADNTPTVMEVVPFEMWLLEGGEGDLEKMRQELLRGRKRIEGTVYK